MGIPTPTAAWDTDGITGGMPGPSQGMERNGQTFNRTYSYQLPSANKSMCGKIINAVVTGGNNVKKEHSTKLIIQCNLLANINSPCSRVTY